VKLTSLLVLSYLNNVGPSLRVYVSELERSSTQTRAWGSVVRMRAAMLGRR